MDELRANERIPALDGLRGIAIGLVMLFHFAQTVGAVNVLDRIVLAGAHTGWIGVDLFFVLSGFLITGILYDTRGANNYFTSFYARRFLRIFPLYYAALTLFFVVLPLLGQNPLGATASRWPWFWFYGSNFLTIWVGYPSRYLQHFWSLAIEEQFYLVWPVLVILFTRRQLIALTAVVAIAAAALRGALYASGFAPITNYFSTVTRADTLAMGAMIALLVRDPVGARWLKRIAGWALLVGVPAVVVLLAHTSKPAWSLWRLPGQILGYSMIGIVCAAIIAWSITGSPALALNRFLRSRPLTFLGQYSYGIYVIHVPIDTAARAMNLHVAALAQYTGSITAGLVLYAIGAGATTIVLALVSWNLLEKRFLALKRYYTPQIDAPPPIVVVPEAGGRHPTPVVLMRQLK